MTMFQLVYNGCYLKNVFWFHNLQRSRHIWPVVTDTPGHIQCQGRQIIEEEQLAFTLDVGRVKESGGFETWSHANTWIVHGRKNGPKVNLCFRVPFFLLFLFIFIFLIYSTLVENFICQSGPMPNSSWTRSTSNLNLIAWRARLVVIMKIIVLRYILKLLQVS